MAEQNNSKWKLGLFVALGIAVFLFFIFYIGKNKNMFSTTFLLQSNFANVSGLAIGNNVRFAGIKVGSVTDIHIANDTTINVTVAVEETVRKFIKKDSKMAIGSDGLMGDKVIIINHGTSNAEIVNSNDVIPSAKPIDTDKLLASLQKTVYNAEVISGELAIVVKKVNSKKGIIGKLLDDDKFSGKISKTLTNLESATGGLSENMEAAKSNILFRGYYKKKARKQREKEEKEGKNEENKDVSKPETTETTETTEKN